MEIGPITSDEMFVRCYHNRRLFLEARDRQDNPPPEVDRRLWEGHKDAIDSVIPQFDEALDQYAIKRVAGR